jgi:Ca2+-binding EF-hand superfamily protein
MGNDAGSAVALLRAVLQAVFFAAAWAMVLHVSLAETPASPPGAQQAVSAKILRYVERLVRKYDLDGNGQLEEVEWRSMQGTPQLADADGDQVITAAEMTRYVANYGSRRNIRLRTPRPETLFVFSLLRSPEDTPPAPTFSAVPPPAKAQTQRPPPRFFVPPSRLPEGLPKWFLERDLDGDGQLTMAEFAEQASRSEANQFGDFDHNGDGLITAGECASVPGVEADTSSAHSSGPLQTPAATRER